MDDEPSFDLEIDVEDPQGDGSSRPRRHLLKRVGAAAVAMALLAGGVGLAIAANDDGTPGAGSPDAAVEELLEALSNEDLLAAAEVLEPTERELLLESTQELVAELARLDVLSSDATLSDLAGVDLDLTGAELTVTRTTEEIALVRIEGVEALAGFDASQLPLGGLVRDRLRSEWLDETGETSGVVEPDHAPEIATVRRDGGWYVSLWYTLAELARLEAGEAFPEAGAPDPVGGDSPEAAVEGLVAELERLDLEGVIGMLDPDEVRALYEYSPLFVPAAQDALDELLSEAGASGAPWDVHTLELSSESNGSDATVFVDAIGFEVELEDMAISLEVADGRSVVDLGLSAIEGSELGIRIEIEGDCVTTTQEILGQEVTDTQCGDQGDDLGLLRGLAGLVPGGGEPIGIEVHRVDGRWYVSPTRTVTEALLTGLSVWDSETLGSYLDAATGLFPSGQLLGSGHWDVSG